MTDRLARRPGCLVLLLATALFALPGGMPPAQASPAQDSTAKDSATKNPQAQVAQAKLAKVKQRIQALTQQQHDASVRRDRINAELATQSAALAKAAAAVRAGAAALADNQHQLDALVQQRDALRDHLQQQRQALAELLRAVYMVGHGSSLRLLLGEGDVARIARALAYSRYFQRDRMQRINDLLGQLRQLQQVGEDIQRQRQQLQLHHQQQQAHLHQRQQAREQQQALLAQAQAQLHDQTQHLHKLRQQRTALTQLLQRLQNVLADIPDRLPADRPFRSRRGKLPWPVHGPAHRRTDGLHIDVPRGTTVRAVAHGRIAYAHWLRGYGLLVVIDHGDGWMSLYGDNESLLHGVGDWVTAGEPIATAGAGSGDNAGVYFGLRHHAKAINPLRWLNKPGK